MNFIWEIEFKKVDDYYSYNKIEFDYFYGKFKFDDLKAY